MSVLLTNCPSDPSSLDLGSNGSKLSEARNGSRRTDDDESNPPFELLCLSSSLGMMLYVELLVGPIAKRKLPGGAGGGGERSLVPGRNARGPKGPPYCKYGEFPVYFHL